MPSWILASCSASNATYSWRACSASCDWSWPVVSPVWLGARRGERQAHDHGGAVPFPAPERDAPAVLLHDLLHAGQPEPRAGNLPGHIAAAPEAIEDVRQVGGGDADARVAHRQHRPPAAAVLLPAQREADRPAGRAVLRRVG